MWKWEALNSEFLHTAYFRLSDETVAKIDLVFLRAVKNPTINAYGDKRRKQFLRFTFNEPLDKAASASIKVWKIDRSEKALPKSSAS